MTQPSTHELMLGDTICELLRELREMPRDTDFDRAYRQGLARALDIIKQEAAAFGIGDSVGLTDFEYMDWVG